MKLQIPQSILKVINVLNNNGYDAYLVGGCVRDAAMGKKPHDFDITTNALPDEMLICFDGWRIIETGLKHGTVTVVSDGENVEITTYRIDGVYLDNRRPESVTFTSTIDEDLSRRDFTVNAMAYNPEKGFVDLFGGRDDLAHGIIRCVGNPDKRFNEDGLRIMRAMRFASVLNFEIEPQTAVSVRRNKHLLKNISAERIYCEIKKLICGVNVAEILSGYYEVMCEIFPELIPAKEAYLKNVTHIPYLPEDYVIRFSCLMAGFDTSDVQSFMNRLKPDNDFKKNVLILTGALTKTLKTDEVSIRYLMSELTDENIHRLAILKSVLDDKFLYDDFVCAYETELKKNPCVSLKQLAINGSQLISLGINQGPELGRCMNLILRAVIENRCENTYESITDFLKINS